MVNNIIKKYLINFKKYLIIINNYVIQTLFNKILIFFLLGYNVSVLIDLENLPENWESLVKKIALLKRHCFASVFEKYFDFQEEYYDSPGTQLQKRAVIQYRDEETM